MLHESLRDFVSSFFDPQINFFNQMHGFRWGFLRPENWVQYFFQVLVDDVTLKTKYLTFILFRYLCLTRLHYFELLSQVVLQCFSTIIVT